VKAAVVRAHVAQIALGSALVISVQCTSRAPQPSSQLRPDLPNLPCPGSSAQPPDRSATSGTNCECIPDEGITDPPEDSDVFSGHYPSIDCFCKDGGCPRSVKEALERLTPECDDRVTVSRSDGCGMIEISWSTGFVGGEYRYDGRSGQIVGATSFHDMCVDPCVCHAVAGVDSCASARSCVICGGDPEYAEYAGPRCQEKLHCGVTPPSRASSQPPSSSPPTR
jgi:hypothetical protein